MSDDKTVRLSNRELEKLGDGRKVKAIADDNTVVWVRPPPDGW